MITRKRVLLLGLIAILLTSSFLLIQTNSYAATIGDQLTAPENGWKRIDNTELTQLVFSGVWETLKFPSGGYYNDSIIATKEVGASAEFKFKGTKIRLIDVMAGPRSTDTRIVIDGIEESFSTSRVTRLPQAITYEKTGLENTLHSVKIYTTSANQGDYLVALDAIDIDADGEIVSMDTPLTLLATAGNSSVALKWEDIKNADSYTINFGIEEGNYTETVVATKDEYGNFIIPGLTNGQIYYFVVRASVNGVLSNYSNEASATPIAPMPTTTEEPTPVITPTPTPNPQSGERAILVVTLNTGLEKEFDISMAEVNEFIAWYEEKQVGSGPTSFAINKHSNNKGPFISRKDYLIHDKILTFEVNEY